MASPVTENAESVRTLVSWKEIAAFLDRSQRTCKRWERERGLPVHRVPGGERGSVFAYAPELREWLLRGSPAQDAANGEEESRAEDELPSDDRDAASPSDRRQIAQAQSGVITPVRRKKIAHPWIMGAVASAAFFAIATAAIISDWSHWDNARSRLPAVHASSSNDQLAPTAQAEEFYLQGRYQWSLR